MTKRVEYTVKVYTVTRWATGSVKGTAVRAVQVEEDATILGGMRAISAAVERYAADVLLDVHSPEIEPNPAALGWPIDATDDATAVVPICEPGCPANIGEDHDHPIEQESAR
jgi:hypothetical protein